MKLAEALSIRKDLQKRIQQLGQRIQNNVKVQEGDAPSEEPTELMKELDACLTQLEDLIWRINATNMKTTNAQGVTLTQLMARKDVLTMRVSNLRSIFDTASAGQDRYSRSEIKTVTVVDVKAIGKKVDECSAQLRQLDGRTEPPPLIVARSRQHPFTMNSTAQAQHVVIRMHGLGRTAHYRPVDYKCRMPSFEIAVH